MAKCTQSGVVTELEGRQARTGAVSCPTCEAPVRVRLPQGTAPAARVSFTWPEHAPRPAARRPPEPPPPEPPPPEG